MVTKQQIQKLQVELRKRNMTIMRLQEDKNIERKKVELMRELKRVKDPKAFLRKQRTIKALKFIGRGTLKGAKKTWNFLGRMAEEDQRLEKLEKKHKKKRRKR